MDELEYERRLSRVEDRAKSNAHRLDRVEEAQDNITELVRSVAAIAQKQTDMDSDIKEIKAEVKLQAGRPAKRWESVVENTIRALVVGLIGWVLIKLGIG